MNQAMGGDDSSAVAYLAAIIDSSDDAIISKNLDGTIMSWNASAERLFGYTAEEVIGRKIAILLPADRLHEEEIILDRLKSGERIDHLETIRVRKDGSQIEVSATISPIRNGSGAVIGASKVVRDITERRLGEVTQSRLAAIVESSSDAIISKDLNGVIQTWNSAAQRLFGYAAEEAIGRSMTMLLPPGREKEELDILATLRAGGKIDHMLTTRVTKSGKLVDVFVTISPIKNLRGEIVGASKVARDIGQYMAAMREREKWTAELERRVEARTHELTLAMKEMESFAHSASHDLRAPLRTIEFNRRMLEESLGDSLTDEIKRLLEKQSGAVERMSLLIDALMNYAKLTHVEINLRPLNITRIAGHVWGELVGEGGAPSFSLELQDNLTAEGDATLVRFVFQNLLQNALKFSPKGGVVSVGQSSDGVFFVRDQGVGFDMEYAGKLFQPFHRLVRESEFPGTGIGLANVKRIVDRHGGRLWADSRPGEGATFFFTLPQSSALESSSDSAAA